MVVFFNNVAYTKNISAIIPAPSFEQRQEGVFNLTASTQIVSNQENSIAVKFIQNHILKATGVKLRKTSVINDKAIIFDLNVSLQEEHGEEGYSLKITNENIIITAATDAGLFYGTQSLRQLLPTNFENADGHSELKTNLSALKIVDKPRFKWRSYMLDEGRTFKGKYVVKKLLDQMALLKLNVFHWHLTEDWGWRIEIKKYPLLTSIGAYRADTQTGAPMDWDSTDMIGEPHGGFYTQDEIKEIVAYAADLNITVIPEIGMPGHVSAAVVAYPFLGTITKDQEVPTTWGVKDVIYNISDPKVMDFIHDVLSEVMSLFPSQIIHIGGDEARYGDWEKSAEIKAYMKELGVETPASLQVQFNNNLSEYLAQNGHRMMGWTEIMGIHLPRGENTDMDEATTALDKDAIVQFWLGTPEQMTEAAMKGHDIVNSETEYTYLDYTYEMISLEKAFRFNPVPEGLSAEYHDKIIGTGTQMWGEFIPTVSRLEQQTYPRIAANASVAWTEKKNMDYDHFISSMESLRKRWDAHNIDYAVEEIK